MSSIVILGKAFSRFRVACAWAGPTMTGASFISWIKMSIVFVVTCALPYAPLNPVSFTEIIISSAPVTKSKKPKKKIDVQMKKDLILYNIYRSINSVCKRCSNIFIGLKNDLFWVFYNRGEQDKRQWKQVWKEGKVIKINNHSAPFAMLALFRFLYFTYRFHWAMHGTSTLQTLN